MNQPISDEPPQILKQNFRDIEEGLAENVPNLISDFSLFITGMGISLSRSWKLTLVGLAIIPLVATIFGGLAQTVRLFTGIELQAYSKANEIATEVILAFKTVVAFGGEHHASERFENELVSSKKAGIRKGLSLGAGRSKDIP